MSSDAQDVVSGCLSVHQGAVSAVECRRLGLSSGQVERGSRGVSGCGSDGASTGRPGAPATPVGKLRAAVLEAGIGAAASHLSEAWLHGFAELPDRLTVTIPHSRGRIARGVGVIRTRIPYKVAVRNRVPTTDVVRTILDCSAVLDSDQIDGLLDGALARRAVRLKDVITAVQHPLFHHHLGRALLEERLAKRGVTGSVAPSVLESRMARLIVEFGLPVPKAELHWGPERRYRLDFAYPEIRLAIEVDGWSAHFTPEQQRLDHRRGNTLARAGWSVLHYDWWEVTFESERVATEIAETYRLLAA